jgi:hypothetical protein
MSFIYLNPVIVHIGGISSILFLLIILIVFHAKWVAWVRAVLCRLIGRSLASCVHGFGLLCPTEAPESVREDSWHFTGRFSLNWLHFKGYFSIAIIVSFSDPSLLPDSGQLLLNKSHSSLSHGFLLQGTHFYNLRRLVRLILDQDLLLRLVLETLLNRSLLDGDAFRTRVKTACGRQVLPVSGKRLKLICMRRWHVDAYSLSIVHFKFEYSL